MADVDPLPGMKRRLKRYWSWHWGLIGLALGQAGNAAFLAEDLPWKVFAAFTSLVGVFLSTLYQELATDLQDVIDSIEKPE